MRVQLRDLAPGQAYALQFRATDGVNLSDWSQIQRFTTTSDTMPPANVTGLVFYDSGSSYIASWNKVTTNGDGTPLLDFRRYRVHVHTAAGDADFYTTGEHFELTREANLGLFNGVTLVTIEVTAQDNNYNESDVPATATLDPTTPPTPSTPTITNLVGLMQVNWDGKNSGGTAMATNVPYLEVHVSTTSGFTPSSATYKGSLTTQSPSYVVTGLNYDTTYYVKLVAVNVFNKKSGASAQASGGPQRISGLDIQNGQIAAEQINWTATGIPGGNAYYSATAPTGGTYTTNDIWYDTANAYTPHHWTGSAWGPAATDVGFIVGTKILAGTLTANAIGTNQIITSSANIGTAVIDAANISTVNAASIVSGSVTAALLLSTGRIAAGSLTGARVEVNATGIAQYASDGTTKLVDINATSASFTGVFQTSTSGRRTVITNSSTLGEIFFVPSTYTGVSPNNKWGYIAEQTEGDGTTEDLQVGVANPTRWAGAGSLWNRINMNSQGWTNFQAEKLDLFYANTGFFVVRQSSDFGATATTRIQADSSGTYLNYTNGTIGVGVSATQAYLAYPSGNAAYVTSSVGSGMLDTGGNTMIQVDTANTGGAMIRFWGRAPYNTGAGTAGIGGYIQIAAANDPNIGSLMQFITAPVSGSRYGALLFYAQDSVPSISNPRFQFQLWDGSAYIPLWASDFHVPSDASVKEEIADFTGSALDIVDGLRVREYYRKPGTGLKRRSEKEIGLVTQEAHPLLIEKNSKGTGIALYRLGTLAIKSSQELHEKIKKLEARIAQLEGKK